MYLYKMIKSSIPRTRKPDTINEVPYEIQEAFRSPFVHDKTESFRAIKEWPPKPSLKPKNHRMIVKRANQFLLGLSEFIVKIKDEITQKHMLLGVDIPPTPGNIFLVCDTQGRFRTKIEWEDYLTAGPVILFRSIVGYPFDSLKTCNVCDHLFFTTDSRKYHCSRKCTSKKTYRDRKGKDGFKEAQLLAAQKYYHLRKKKWKAGTTPKEKIEFLRSKWISEGVDEKLIKRILFSDK
jgi:hypothetical protein